MGSDAGRGRDLEVVGAGSEVVPDDEPRRLAVSLDPGIDLVHIDGDLRAFGVEHLDGQGSNGADREVLGVDRVNAERVDCLDFHVGGLGKVHPEEVGVLRRVDPAGCQGPYAKARGRANGAARVRYGLGMHPVVPGCPLPSGFVTGAAHGDVVDPLGRTHLI